MASSATPTEVLRSLELNEERFLNLLSKMMENVESLQNNPSQVRHDCDALCPSTRLARNFYENRPLILL